MINDQFAKGIWINYVSFLIESYISQFVVGLLSLISVNRTNLEKGYTIHSFFSLECEFCPYELANAMSDFHVFFIIIFQSCCLPGQMEQSGPRRI